MKNSLQEQLLKAGLATEQQINKANSSKGKERHQKNKHVPKAKRKESEDDLAAAYAARRKAEQDEQAAQQRLAAQRKANRAMVANLIKEHTLNKEDGENAFQFVVGSNVKKVYVTPELKKGLINGSLGITFMGGKRCVMSRAHLEKIRELDPEKTLFINDPIEDDSSADEYAGFEIPDDLDW